MGKSENRGFSETIAASDLKVGRCRQLIEFMKDARNKLRQVSVCVGYLEK